MASRNRPLTIAQSSQYRSALALLQARRTSEALRSARALAGDAPDAADAQQLLGMALADSDDHDGAERAFRRALVLAPASEVVRLNFAGFLRRRGRARDALAVLDAVPDSAHVATQRGLLALQLGERQRACDELRRAVELDPAAHAAWRGLGNALRESGELDAAEAAFRKAIELAPGQAAGWLGLGILLRLRGRIGEALSLLRAAERCKDATPDLQDAINGVLYDMGRAREALDGARRLVAMHPGYVAGLETLTNLLWEGGPGVDPDEDPLRTFADAAARAPDDFRLQLRFARMLLAARRGAEAFAFVSDLQRRHPGDPVLDWYAAEACDAIGERKRAAGFWSAAAPSLEQNPQFLNGWARHAFRAGSPELAERCAARVVQVDPRNQEGWGHLGTAWRLAGDPREEWLFDYERLVGHVEVAPPDGYAGMDDFLRAFASVLERLHLATHAPLEQSVRNGSQTPGRLFGREDPVIRAAESTLRAAVLDWIARLPRDPRHPFLSRVTGDMRMVGSWSVRLWSSGRHSNHIHNEGWMSSAFHVALPPSVGDGTGAGLRAGWLQFGQPLEDLELDLSSGHALKPVPGRLALFPSYLWHGTVPFDDLQPRLTVAFDMQPV